MSRMPNVLMALMAASLAPLAAGEDQFTLTTPEEDARRARGLRKEETPEERYKRRQMQQEADKLERAEREKRRLAERAELVKPFREERARRKQENWKKQHPHEQ